MKKYLACLFRVPPDSWGARGDPYLWKELEGYFQDIEIPRNWLSIQRLIDDVFLELCGLPINTTEWFYVERFAHGGMSSGHVEPTCWIEGGKISNHLKLQFNNLK